MSYFWGKTFFGVHGRTRLGWSTNHVTEITHKSNNTRNHKWPQNVLFSVFLLLEVSRNI